MKTVAEQKEELKRLQNMTGERVKSTPPLPANLDAFNSDEMVTLFKMMSLVESGTMANWELVRTEYIKHKKAAPNSKKMDGMKANLLAQIKKKNLSQEDIILNEMNLDTNDIISKIQDGTTNIDAGEEELEKMKMVEGDMPGQGKQKQGKWRS
jgi:hypothetical protein